MISLLREQASSFAADVDNLILMVTVLSAFWFLVAEGIFFYFCFRYRRKPGVKAQYISGEKKEEMKWIHLPHNIVLVCDIFVIVYAVYVWYNIKQKLPQPDETIRIVGQQWTWRFVDPGLDHKLGTDDDVETVDEVHLVVDKVYHFKLESIDVLHSFSIPVFRLKQDAIPGRVVTGWFKPTKTGVFDMQCAEICGIGHGLMRSKVVVESVAEHEGWLKTFKQVAANP